MKLDIQTQDHPKIIHHFCKAHPPTLRLEKRLLNNDLSLPPSQVQPWTLAKPTEYMSPELRQYFNQRIPAGEPHIVQWAGAVQPIILRSLKQNKLPVQSIIGQRMKWYRN